MNIFVGRVPEKRVVVISMVDDSGRGMQGFMSVEHVDVLIDKLKEHRDAFLVPDSQAEEASKIVIKKAMRKDDSR